VSDHQVYLDANRHTYLQYRDSGKVRHFITLRTGTIDCIQLTAKDYMRLKPYDKKDAKHFAKVYLESPLAISRQAKVILRGLLGHSEALEEAPRFDGGTVTLEEIAEANGWDPSKSRKFLRKSVEKPGSRWAWTPEEAEKIQAMLKEYFCDDSA